jgi:MFS family permease
MAFVALATNLLGGWLSDRIRLGRLLGMMMGGQIVASLGLVIINTVWGQALFVFGYGLGVGLFGILNVVTWPRLFGQYGLGRIVSMGMSVIILMTAIGPVLFSLVKALAGTYQMILYFWPVLAAGMILVSWRVEEDFHTKH